MCLSLAASVVSCFMSVKLEREIDLGTNGREIVE